MEYLYLLATLLFVISPVGFRLLAMLIPFFRPDENFSYAMAGGNLIALAITVAFGASLGASLGLLSHVLNFWWELALLIVIMLLVVVVGTAMDMAPTILILTPVLMPVIKAAGIDPVYFGVLFIINNAIGLITPPVGTVLNVVAGVGKISMDEVTKGVVPFMIAQFAIMQPHAYFVTTARGGIHDENALADAVEKIAQRLGKAERKGDVSGAVTGAVIKFDQKKI